MKNVRNIQLSSTVRNVLATAVMAFLLLFASSAVYAGNKVPTLPVEIKYLGSIQDKPVFEIRLDNESGDDLYLSLNDENGNLIYSDVVRDKKYTRKIQLENLEPNTLKVIVNLRSKKVSQSEVFEINKSIRTVENVEVTKVK